MFMLTELEQYYARSGILATKFTCKHKKECSAGCMDFTGPKSAFVSKGYEHGNFPRVLFLSLDSGSGKKISKQRLPLAVRSLEESTDVLALPKHKHWFRTHELAWYFLKLFNPQLQIEETKSYFAHANSAKCCMNKAQKKKADQILFKNCQEYLGSELLILDPDILITQGSEAKKAILKLLQQQVRKIDDYASIILLNHKQVFWLHTYHPNNWGKFNRQRSYNRDTGIADGWVFYAKRAFKWLMKR